MHILSQDCVLVVSKFQEMKSKSYFMIAFVYYWLFFGYFNEIVYCSEYFRNFCNMLLYKIFWPKNYLSPEIMLM